jgi:hypothetical protein
MSVRNPGRLPRSRRHSPGFFLLKPSLYLPPAAQGLEPVNSRNVAVETRCHRARALNKKTTKLISILSALVRCSISLKMRSFFIKISPSFFLVSVYGITQLFSTKESPLTNGKKNNMIYGGVF